MHDVMEMCHYFAHLPLERVTGAALRHVECKARAGGEGWRAELVEVPLPWKRPIGRLRHVCLDVHMYWEW